MNTRLTVVMMALVIAVVPAWAANDETTEKENHILSLVLTLPDPYCGYPDGGYTVVESKTRLQCENTKDLRESVGERINGYLEFHKIDTNGADIRKLVDQLFERNKKPVRLSLRSSKKDGYVVYDTMHPAEGEDHSQTTVSVPAYDKKSGLVLVSFGFRKQPLVGVGQLILYKYEQGKLKKLWFMPLWIA